MCTIHKDKYDALSQPENSTDNSILEFSNIQSKVTNLDSLKIYIQNTKTFNELQELFYGLDNVCGNKAILFINHFCTLYKQDNSGNITHKDFLDSLCKTIEGSLHLYNIKNLTYIFNFVKISNIHQSSSLYQKLLKLMVENFNSFNQADILFIYLSVINLDQSYKYVRALKLACLEYMVHCLSKAEKLDIPLNFLSHFAIKTELPVFLRIKILENLLGNDYSDIHPKIYRKVITALVIPDVKEFSKKSQNLCNKFITFLKENINNTWSAADIVTIIKKYKIGILNKTFWYDEYFCDKIALLSVQNNFSLKHAIHIMRYLCQLPHFNNSLLEYIISLAFRSDTDEISKSLDFSYLIHIMACTTFLRTHDVNWDFYKQKILDSSFLSADITDVNLLFNTSLNLEILGIHNNKIIQQVLFQKRQIMNKDVTFFGKWSLLLLHQSLSVLHPGYEGTYLEENFLQSLRDSLSPLFAPHLWETTVDKCFGGANQVLKNCTTPFHHLLTYAVFLDDSNKPIDVSSIKNKLQINPNNLIDIEKLHLECKYKILVILEFPMLLNICFRNVDCLTGHGSLYVKTLETLGYNVVHLYPFKYKKLLPTERLPYLINIVEQKCGSLYNRTFEENVNT